MHAYKWHKVLFENTYQIGSPPSHITYTGYFFRCKKDDQICSTTGECGRHGTSCADPENFVRWCPTLTTFSFSFKLMRGGRIQVPL